MSKRMTKLAAILSGCDLIDKLFKLRENQIKTAISAALNDIEQQAVQAEIEYEAACEKLGNKETTSYKPILEEMAKCKKTILDAERTIAIYRGIEADLKSEVEIEDKGK